MYHFILPPVSVPGSPGYKNQLILSFLRSWKVKIRPRPRQRAYQPVFQPESPPGRPQIPDIFPAVRPDPPLLSDRYPAPVSCCHLTGSCHHTEIRNGYPRESSTAATISCALLVAIPMRIPFFFKNERNSATPDFSGTSWRYLSIDISIQMAFISSRVIGSWKRSLK